jgi:ABC-type bacteriocin/lantibiotic exporter with double-glycine peptidase domain
VNLSFRENGFYGITGPSGSGKTRLLRLLNGLTCPTKGGVRYRGTDLFEHTLPALRRRILLLEQEPLALPGTVEENLLLPFQFRAHEGSVPDRERLSRALDDVGLPGEFIRESAEKLSGGEKQRMVLARALLLEPEVLLLDEPTSALDRTSEARVVGLLERTKGARTVVAVSHSAPLLRLSDRLVVLEAGRVTETHEHPTDSELTDILRER